MRRWTRRRTTATDANGTATGPRLTLTEYRATRVDEVDRLERKVVTQEDMYGRANPKPLPPSFDAEDMRKMRAAEETRLLRLRDASSEDAWLAIGIPDALGLTFDTYKWRQNQSFVEVFVKLPTGARKHDVEVTLDVHRLVVRVRGAVIIDGTLHAAIKAELSTWIIVDDVLEMSLLKRNRRGHYENGTTNSDTFWPSLLIEDAKRGDRALPPIAPSVYFETEYEIDKDVDNNSRKSSSRPMIASRR